MVTLRSMTCPLLWAVCLATLNQESSRQRWMFICIRYWLYKACIPKCLLTLVCKSALTTSFPENWYHRLLRPMFCTISRISLGSSVSVGHHCGASSRLFPERLAALNVHLQILWDSWLWKNRSVLSPDYDRLPTPKEPLRASSPWSKGSWLARLSLALTGSRDFERFDTWLLKNLLVSRPAHIAYRVSIWILRASNP